MNPNLSVRDARNLHFRQYELPLDGGYEDKWTALKFGPLTFYIFNSESRKRAVKLHDIHHLVTGYKSDPRGEAEISAWELAAGIHDKHFARFINLGGLFYGAYLYPKTTFLAYLRGRYSQTLYDQEFSECLLDQKLHQLREKLLPEKEVSASLADYLNYILLVGTLSLLPLMSLIFMLLVAFT